jgi:hypothetical protein
MPLLKQALLLALPSLVLVLGCMRSPRHRGLPVIAGCLLGFLMLVLCFGNRLWLHHAIMLLPLLYAGLGLALEWLAAQLGPVSGIMPALAASLVLLPLQFANAADRQALFQTLRITGGVGLYSDAIPRFAEDSLRQQAASQMFFPDWGVFMPFAMMTRGAIPYRIDFRPEAARATLCGGRDVVVVLLDGKGEPDRLRNWSAVLGWSDPSVSHYAQRDGRNVLTVARWHARLPPAGAC